MNIDIKVIPGAKKNKVLSSGGLLKVYVTAPASDNKGNKAACRVMAGYYGVKENCASIIKGLKSRFKTIKIEN